MLYIITFSNFTKALELTLYVNNWLDEIPETYSVHTDQYIFLEDKLSSTLSDVLGEVSAFNAVRSGPKGSQTSLFTRGTNSNHTLVTLNGSPITDHSTSNGLSDLGLIDTSLASKLHLVDGPMSTLYGANAVGGVIDIQTDQSYTNKFKTIIGSRGEKKISLQNNFGESKEFNVGINIDKTDGISIYPHGDEKDGYELFSTNLGYTGELNTTEFELLYINNTQDTDLDASGSDDLDYTGNTEFNFFQFNSNTDLSIGKLNFIIDTYSWDREYINGSEIDNYYSKSNHIKAVHILKNKKINNVFGYDQLFLSADFENRGSYNSSVDKNSQQYGIFDNFDYLISTDLTLSGGYRIDDNSLFGNQNSYRIGAIYNLNKFSFFNSIATGYKNPTFYEMFGADSYGYSGNPNLKPETSLNREIGINYKSKKSNIKVSVYDTDIKDMIKYANSTYSNDFDGSSNMQGININANYFFDKFRIMNSYAHVHSVDSSKNWLKRRPHDTLNSSFYYFIGDLVLNPELNYYGKHSDTHSSNYSTILIKDRSIFNMKISYKSFDLKIYNVFNDDFERPHGYNQGGLDIKFSYSLKF